jgi:hypothetical protein
MRIIRAKTLVQGGGAAGGKPWAPATKKGPHLLGGGLLNFRVSLGGYSSSASLANQLSARMGPK